MDVYENLVCNDCGMPLNDAVLAGCGSFLCCSALWSDVPGMVCPISERPLFCFKNHFNPGGNRDMNLFKHNEKEVNSTFVFLASGDIDGSKHLGRHDGSKVELSSGQDGACSQGVHVDFDKLQAGNIGVCSNGKLENEAEGRSIPEDSNGTQTPCSTNQNEAEGRLIPEDSNGAQTPCSTNEGRELSEQANDSLCMVNRALFRISSRVDENRNVQKQPTKSDVEIISSEKDIAPGTSSRTPDMNFACIKMLESRFADLENKVARQDSNSQLKKVVDQHDSLLRENICHFYRQHMEIEVNQQRNALIQLQNEFNKLKIKYETLHGNVIQAHVKIARLQESSLRDHQVLAALHQKADFNKQRIERLVRRLDNMNEKVDAYTSLLRGVDIQSVA